MTRAIPVLLVVMGAIVLLGRRRFRVEPRGAPAPIHDDIDWLREWVIEPRPVYATASEWRH